MLLKISKNSTKSKVVSSYMLSGINIKRMIQDEMASENNASDISIIRVNKRPIFKLKEKEKEREKENNTSVIGSLPNKSFKIRSYTRKMKDEKEEESCELFEKVEKIRNCRANSNRIELFNLSKENREKDDN
jgi:vacuolar-type H+-ATPase subunit F/Vma7